MMKSWKTSVAGIATFGVVLCAAVAAHFDGDPLTEANWGVVVAAFIASVGLIMARDHDVSSENAGAK